MNSSIAAAAGGVLSLRPKPAKKSPRKIANDSATATAVNTYALIIDQPASAPAKGPKLRPIYTKYDPASGCRAASTPTLAATITTPSVPMKYDIQHPSPARPATMEMFSAGVSVGAIAARDWPTVSIRFSAPERKWEMGLSPASSPVFALINRPLRT